MRKSILEKGELVYGHGRMHAYRRTKVVVKLLLQLKASFVIKTNQLLVFRTVNMLEMTKLSDEDVWKIVKDIRKKFLYEHDDPKCERDGPFLFNNEKVDYNTYYIKDLTNELADKLKLNTTYETNENISYKILQTGAEMFLYLNYCPYKLDKSYDDDNDEYGKSFWSLMNHVLKTETPKDILLALTVLQKTPIMRLKTASQKIFRRVMERINLLQFEQIQMITGNCLVNGTSGNCENKMNFDEKKLKALCKFYS